MEKTNPNKLWKSIISKNDICVLATSSLSGKPEAATIRYAADSNFMLYFRTTTKHRKYQNLKSNPKASIVINMLPHTLQMEGDVEELTHKKRNTALKILMKKEKAKIEPDGNLRFFRFTPRWVRIRIEGTENPYHIIKG